VVSINIKLKYRYQEVGGPVFTIFFFWRVMIITLDPEDIKVWSLTLPMHVKARHHEQSWYILTTNQLSWFPCTFLMPSCTTKVPVQVISQVIHSVLLVIMFIAQDITTKPRNNKPENFVWFFRNLFGQRYLSLLSCV